MHTAPQLFPVPFHGDMVVLVGQDNEPYVAMKPIVSNMGLAWQPQHAKLTANKERWGVTIIVTPSIGGQQEAICLPLRKLASWLMTVSPNRVAPELREKIIRYQEECDDALWNYWTHGVAERSSAGATAGKQIALSRHRLTLLKELHRTRDRSMRCAIHEQLAQVSRSLGLSVPELESIGRAAPETPEVVRAFWEGVAFLEGAGERCNHAGPGSGKVFLNLTELREMFRKHQINLVIDRVVTQALPLSQSPRFSKADIFTSCWTKKKMRGWIFIYD